MGFFNQLTRPRLADFVRKHLGEDIRFESVSPELGLHHVLGNDRREWFLHKGETLWAFTAAIAANVGNVGHIEVLAPPAVADLIVVVEHVSLFNPIAGNAYSLRYDGAAGGAIVQNDVLDTRIRGLKAESQNAILNTTVGVSGIIIDQLVSSTVDTRYFQVGLPFVLTPGHRLAVWCGTQNSGFSVSMSGYEYHGKAEELTL